MVKKAQGEKPPVQQMADRISAIFVPVVLGIAVVTLVVNWIVLSAFAPGNKVKTLCEIHKAVLSEMLKTERHENSCGSQAEKYR